MAKAALGPTTTGVSRRHGPVVEELGYPSRFVRGALTPAPAVAAIAPRPLGDLSQVPAERLAELMVSTWQVHPNTASRHRKAAAAVVDYLACHQGSTWQQRWDAAPVSSGAFEDEALPFTRASLAAGARALFCLRVIQPTLAAFRAHKFTVYAEMFRAAQGDPQLDKYFEHVAEHDQISWNHRQEALTEVCSLLTVQGVAFADLTPAALLHHGHEVRKITRDSSEATSRTRFPGQLAWSVLHEMGQFPADAPHTLREALVRGQLTVEELVDRYPIRNLSVRQLLIDYLRRRKAGSDYSTLNQLSRTLASHFWCGIEQINPQQADLRIAPEVYEAWRDGLRAHSRPEVTSGQDGVLITVRSFYWDLHTWAVEEPEHWAIWVAPCPVPPGELRGLGERRRRINERSADRTRLRQPLLPALVAHIEERYDHARALLAQAGQAETDAVFTVGGRVYRRLVTNDDVKKARRNDAVPVRAVEESTGRRINVTAEEESTFWTWAVMQVLRHSGVRIEELLEITHMSVRQYQRANGEVIALLVIAPSKTDRERVIPMSAELFHAIAQLILRHTRDGRTVPVIRRFDHHEKVWSPPLPYLFQRVLGARRAVWDPNTVTLMIKRSCAELAETNQAFRGLEFTPHDFRRIFTTELVNSGLPIHIGAALLGHLDIRTTRGYVAVFDEDVVRHSMEFFERRRKLRPEGEYRPVTEQEWAEFEEHFDKRKVELGSCARPYGTPCQHEHACIRCPMLHVNPKMLGRIDELEADLLARRERAVAEQWAGEIDGIDLTLALLRTKREEALRLGRRPAVNLGIPTPRTNEPPQEATA